MDYQLVNKILFSGILKTLLGKDQKFNCSIYWEDNFSSAILFIETTKCMGQQSKILCKGFAKVVLTRARWCLIALGSHVVGAQASTQNVQTKAKRNH